VLSNAVLRDACNTHTQRFLNSRDLGHCMNVTWYGSRHLRMAWRYWRKKIYSRIGARKIILERTIRSVKSRKFCLRFEERDYGLVKKTLRSWMGESVWGDRVDWRTGTHQSLLKCAISGFRREVAENCAVLGHYAASSGNFLPMFRDNLSVPKEHISHFVTVMLWACEGIKVGPPKCVPLLSSRVLHGFATAHSV
jgi:hypothetical protein